MRNMILIIAILFMSDVLVGCKQRVSGQLSNVKDTSAPRLSGQAPVTHYALKSGVRRLFDSIRLVQSGVEDGAYVYTVTDFRFSQFEHNINGVSASILLNLSIDASKSQAVTRRVDAGVNLSFTGQAKVLVDVTYQGQTISVNYRGLQWTQPLTHRINTWTNARLLRGLVLSKATEAANAAVPETKRSIIQKLDQELRNGIATQSANFERYFSDISLAMQDVPGAIPRLTSDASGAYFQHHIAVKNPSVVKNPPMTPQDVDAGFLFHEETFSTLLARTLDGKTIKIEDVGVSICKAFSQSLFKFCVSEKKAAAIDVSVKFSERESAVFNFNDGLVVLNLKASALLSTNVEASQYLEKIAEAAGITSNATSQEPGTSLETTEKDATVKHLTPEFEVKVSYKLGNRSFDRADLDVKIVTPNDQGGYLTKHSLYREGLVLFLKEKMAQSLPLSINVPAVPTYASHSNDVQKIGGSMVVLRREHFGIRDNWLYTYFSYCSAGDTQTALGINLRSILDSEKTPRLRVTAVTSGAPASKAAVTSFIPQGLAANSDVKVDYRPAPGLRPEDIIYSVDQSDALVVSPEIFSGSLAGKSLSSDSKVILKVGRFEVLEGLDKPVWMMLDMEVTLRKVCKTST
jgi:hypothetical protein